MRYSWTCHKILSRVFRQTSEEQTTPRPQLHKEKQEPVMLSRPDECILVISEIKHYTKNIFPLQSVLQCHSVLSVYLYWLLLLFLSPGSRACDVWWYSGYVASCVDSLLCVCVLFCVFDHFTPCLVVSVWNDGAFCIDFCTSQHEEHKNNWIPDKWHWIREAAIFFIDCYITV